MDATPFQGLMKFDIYPHQGHPARAKELFEQAQSDSLLPHLAAIVDRLTPSCWRVRRWKDAWKASALPPPDIQLALTEAAGNGQLDVVSFLLRLMQLLTLTA